MLDLGRGPWDREWAERERMEMKGGKKKEGKGKGRRVEKGTRFYTALCFSHFQLTTVW